MRPYSRALHMPAPFLPRGSTITIPCGLTVASTICHPLNTPKSAHPECNGTGRLSNLGAPRPIPLLRANHAQMTIGLCSLADERWGADHGHPKGPEALEVLTRCLHSTDERIERAPDLPP